MQHKAGKHLPFAPKNLNDWTEDHYALFAIFELALGNRRILTKEEIEEKKAEEKANKIMEEGGENWLQETQEALGLSMNDETDEMLQFFLQAQNLEEEK